MVSVPKGPTAPESLSPAEKATRIRSGRGGRAQGEVPLGEVPLAEVPLPRPHRGAVSLPRLGLIQPSHGGGTLQLTHRGQFCR